MFETKLSSEDFWLLLLNLDVLCSAFSFSHSLLFSNSYFSQNSSQCCKRIDFLIRKITLIHAPFRSPWLFTSWNNSCRISNHPSEDLNRKISKYKSQQESNLFCALLDSVELSSFNFKFGNVGAFCFFAFLPGPFFSLTSNFAFLPIVPQITDINKIRQWRGHF